MKTLRKLFYMLLVLAMGGVVACTTDETTDGQFGEGVFFSKDETTVLYLKSKQTTFKVPVYRSNYDTELTVDVYGTLDETIFTYSETITFNPGKSRTYIEVELDPELFEIGKKYELTFELDSEGNLTPYGLSTLKVTVSKEPWTPIGTGYFRDGMVGEFFMYYGLPGNVTERQVEIEQSDLEPTNFRLVEPYSDEFAAAIFNMDITMMAGVCSPETNYLHFKIDDQNRVAFYRIDHDGDGKATAQYTGFDLGSGEVAILSYVPEFFPDWEDNGSAVPMEEYYGVYDPEKKTCSFLTAGIAVYDDAGGMLCNTDGMTRIVMPGGVNREPALTASLDRLWTDSEYARYATFKAKMNKDCDYFRLTVVEGDISQDAEKLAEVGEALQEGSVAYVESSENGEVSIEYPRKGLYTAVFAPFTNDENNTMGTLAAVTFLCENEAIAPLDFALEVDLSLGDTWGEATLKPNSDKLYYFWDILEKDLYDEMQEYGVTLDTYTSNLFYVLMENLNAMGYDYTVNDVISMLARSGESTISLDRLYPGQEYIYYYYCIDLETGNSRSAEIAVNPFTMPELTYSSEYGAWLGDWTVTSTSNFTLNSKGYLEDLEESYSFDVTLSPRESDKSFYVNGWNDQEMWVVPSQGEYANEFPIFWNQESNSVDVHHSYLVTDYGTAWIIYSAFVEYVLPEDETATPTQTFDFDYDQVLLGELSVNPALVGTYNADGTVSMVGQKHQLQYDRNKFVEADVLGLHLIYIDLYQGGIAPSVTSTVNIPTGPYTWTRKVVDEQPSDDEQPTVLAKQLLDEKKAQSPKTIRMENFKLFNRVLAR